jgi:hypothetical protein
MRPLTHCVASHAKKARSYALARRYAPSVCVRVRQRNRSAFDTTILLSCPPLVTACGCRLERSTRIRGTDEYAGTEDGATALLSHCSRRHRATLAGRSHRRPLPHGGPLDGWLLVARWTVVQRRTALQHRARARRSRSDALAGADRSPASRHAGASRDRFVAQEPALEDRIQDMVVRYCERDAAEHEPLRSVRRRA